MRYGSLFSGYGGLDRAVEEVFGAKATWHSEIEPAACKVLGHRWPGVPNLGSVAKVDWSQVEPVDIMCGGFPCTDLSAAGKRAGLNPETRSGLWSHFAAGIKALRPSLVVIENVRGLTSASAVHPAHELGFCEGCLGVEPERVVLRSLGAVLGDLADAGFDAEWLGLPASGIGAPHPRFRIIVLAWPAPDASDVGYERGRGTRGRRSGSPDRVLPSVAHADCSAIRHQPVTLARGGGEAVTGDAVQDGCEGRAELDGEAIGRGGERGDDADGLGVDARWGEYGPAIRRWERVLGRVAPEPTTVGRNGQPKLSDRFVEFLMGLPDGWVTDVGGTVNENLKMLGNGVVPQQAAAGIRLLIERVEGEWNSRSA